MTFASAVFRCFLLFQAAAQTPNPNCINSTKVRRLAPIHNPSVPPRFAVKGKSHKIHKTIIKEGKLGKSKQSDVYNLAVVYSMSRGRQHMIHIKVISMTSSVTISVWFTHYTEASKIAKAPKRSQV